jgi:hypothetical protein
VAPRAYWKGHLKLSLVSCPISLYPATSEREKISFHQLHKQTGNRIKYKKVDAETGREVEPDDIIKGYEVGKGEVSNSTRRNSTPSRWRAIASLRSTSSSRRQTPTSFT